MLRSSRAATSSAAGSLQDVSDNRADGFDFTADFIPSGPRFAFRTRVEAGFASRRPRVLFIPGWPALPPENQGVLSDLERIPPAARPLEVLALANRFIESNEEKASSIEYADRLRQIAEAGFLLHRPSGSYQFQARSPVMDTVLTGTPMIGLRIDFGEEPTGIIGPCSYHFDDRTPYCASPPARSPIRPRLVTSERAW